MKIPPGRTGYQTVSMYLHVADARAALSFYAEAFGAREVMRLTLADGRIGHAEMQIGDTRVMIADESPEFDIHGPESLGGSTTHFKIFVGDADAAMHKALAAGATALRPVQDEFYGDRSGTVSDPFGHRWTLSTPVEEVGVEEMQRRLDALFSPVGREQT